GRVLQTFANLIVLIAYFRNEKCRKEDAIILLVSLASIDFLYAILFIPYVIYLLIGWVPYGASYDYSPKIILATGGLPAALMKSGCVLTAFIAIDRNVALYFPAKYYGFEKRRILLYAYMFALLMGIIDECVLFMSTSIAQHPNCSTFACFTSPYFQIYWGISNMFVNTLSCALTFILLIALRRTINNILKNKSLEKKRIADKSYFQIYWGMSNMFVNTLSCALTFILLIALRRTINNILKNKSLEKKRIADKSATRTAFCILAISAIFGVVPGLINGCATFLKLELLSDVGFFVDICASVSGLSHAFIFAMAHRDIQQAIVEIFTGRKFHVRVSNNRGIRSQHVTAYGTPR
uniref:G_PROTEIN_RECEP_F1_2 domain-containing protein n=1 Tax=Ascaris lumbricoides TaxID=6252 RepID=A0A0M3IM10_ASCLU